MERYVVYADKKRIGHTETEKKAWLLARKYEYECFNQDEPYYPKMEVQRETLE